MITALGVKENIAKPLKLMKIKLPRTDECFLFICRSYSERTRNYIRKTLYTLNIMKIIQSNIHECSFLCVEHIYAGKVTHY